MTSRRNRNLESRADSPDLEVGQMLDTAMMLSLRLGTFLCFAGWTWVHFYWEAPYGVLLWHESTYDLAASLGISWEEFVGTGAGDGLVQKWMARVGWIYLICAVFSITLRQRSRFQMLALLGGGCLLGILSFAKFVRSQYELPMLVEQGGQILMPVLLVMAVALGIRHRLTVFTAVVALIMTFAGHGSYALGLWPTPASFFAMTTVILDVDYDTAKLFLRTAGILDFAVCIGILFRLTRCPSAIYAAVWGFVTAVARPVAGMSWSLIYWGADQFIHEALIRAPHYLIPIYLALYWSSSRDRSVDDID